MTTRQRHFFASFCSLWKNGWISPDWFTDLLCAEELRSDWIWKQLKNLTAVTHFHVNCNWNVQVKPYRPEVKWSLSVEFKQRFPLAHGSQMVEIFIICFWSGWDALRQEERRCLQLLCGVGRLAPPWTRFSVPEHSNLSVMYFKQDASWESFR